MFYGYIVPNKTYHNNNIHPHQDDFVSAAFHAGTHTNSKEERQQLLYNDNGANAVQMNNYRDHTNNYRPNNNHNHNNNNNHRNHKNYNNSNSKRKNSNNSNRPTQQQMIKSNEPVPDDDKRLTKAATIGTVLMVVNSHSDMLLMVMVVGFFHIFFCNSKVYVDTSYFGMNNLLYQNNVMYHHQVLLWTIPSAM